MEDFGSALVLAGVVAALVLGVYGVSAAVRLRRAPVTVAPFLSGEAVTEHAVSRYHVRWYTVTLLFLAFDMEMVFMYPWVLVVTDKGAPAVVEMFAFLAVLAAAVVYAWRKGHSGGPDGMAAAPRRTARLHRDRDRHTADGVSCRV
ncbi:NADH-quinone oxidoreductase subunit A [Nocardiopsis alborubida]|uniref:NADH-quinone oxidoreductase subunit n=1 Tax=Nocardiopsis alborubida TaxID=146802 RepID=A0A7X6MBF6_9ACTN|nr:NADH-quinone oxidoreductase subunit A [Nocardiopsis alborubida]NKY96675.1 NADH-quinone oxidoreductase subunit A [Nocardiopsis alborubida]